MHSLRDFPSLAAGVAFLATLSGCSSVRSSSMATTPRGAPPVTAEQVRIGATHAPDGAEQLGIVETHGNCNEGMPALMNGFRAEVGRIGGDFGKVDTMHTRFQMVPTTQQQSYPVAPRQHLGRAIGRSPAWWRWASRQLRVERFGLEDSDLA